MANDETPKKSGSGTEHKAHWQQPWAQRVLQGQYSPFEKLLFMRAASFGAKGCIMYSRTLARELGCCERYVREGIAKLWKGGELWITGWDSRNRTIYAIHNPEVVAMAKARYKAELKDGKVADKDDFYRKNKTRGYTTRNDSTGMETNNPEP
jgi:hypothetical protein